MAGANACMVTFFSCLQVAVGVEDRACKTLPTGLSLSLSKIKNAGRGVWTDVNIHKFTRFVPYE